MNLPIPGLLFGAIVSLVIFYYYNREMKVRRKKKRENLRKRQKENLNSLIDNLKSRKPEESNGNNT
jgi:hypothetical protein